MKFFRRLIGRGCAAVLVGFSACCSHTTPSAKGLQIGGRAKKSAADSDSGKKKRKKSGQRDRREREKEKKKKEKKEKKKKEKKKEKKEKKSFAEEEEEGEEELCSSATWVILALAALVGVLLCGKQVCAVSVLYFLFRPACVYLGSH